LNSGKLGKEVEATLRQNVGKNFLGKTNLRSRNPRFGRGSRGRGRMSAGAGGVYGLTKRVVKIPALSLEDKEKGSPMAAPSCRVPQNSTKAA
jgi:hypothetical protein